MVWLLVGAFALVLALNVFILWRLTIAKGMDPSLITYANPLAVGNYAVLRACLVSGALVIFGATGLGQILLGVVLFGNLLNIFFLMIFARAPTQPAAYLGLAATASLALLIKANPYTAAFAVALFISQEIYLLYWRRRQSVRYELWVEKTALNVFHKYARVFKELPELAQFAVLHIATTENIARPRIVRLGEKAYFKFKHPPVISTGIMQVAATNPLSDEQSLRAGAKIVVESLSAMPKSLVDLPGQIKWLAKHYNGSTTYSTYLERTYTGVARAWHKINARSDASAKAPSS